MSTPYKEKSKLIEEISKFVNSHNANIANHSRRISDYFEMICYNNTVNFYKKNKYQISIENLDRNRNFVYKLSTTGLPEKFSFFKVSKEYKSKVHTFEIHHNISVESCLSEGIYFVPDISVIEEDSIKLLKGFYHNRRFAYCPNEDLQTFFECKHLNPFPEVLFSYVGLLHEMMNEAFQGRESTSIPKHMSPSLIFSGNGNDHSIKIKQILMERYNVNIIFGLFYKESQMTSRGIRKIGQRNV